MRDDAQQGEDGVDLRGQSNRCAGEQLAAQDLNGIEPIQRLRVGAIGNAIAVVAFTVAPQADGVEVVQTEGLGDTVDEDRVRDGDGDNVGEVEEDEVDLAAGPAAAGVAYLDEDEEDDGDEEEEGGDEGPDEAGAGCSFDLGFGGLEVIGEGAVGVASFVPRRSCLLLVLLAAEHLVVWFPSCLWWWC